mmetsp:Transcript_13384/g.24221  ORF Transcript_13384/g.24221 Transcript_13384/m.24221 type:complete len:1818 (-) Transcript_13384:501-5954(-)
MQCQTFLKSFVTSLLIIGIGAASNGKLGSGDGFCWDVMKQIDEIGCDPKKWTGGDHEKCTMTGRVMDWAGQPVYSSKFLLYTDPGVTQYKAGEWLNIHLKTKAYADKFRGLVIHASDSNENMVGEWRATDDSGENAKFWHPAPNCVLHTQGDLKPLLVSFQFKAPANAGTLKFHAMVKCGPANDGFFYLANGIDENLHLKSAPAGGWPGRGNVLTLTEDKSSPKTNWGLAAKGQSCDAYCQSKGKSCDLATMRSITTPSAAEAAFVASTGCQRPYVPSCSSVAPAVEESGKCWYNGANGNSGVCTGGNAQAKSTCGSSHNKATRICACKSGASTQSFGEAQVVQLQNYENEQPVNDHQDVEPIMEGEVPEDIGEINNYKFSSMGGTMMAAGFLIAMGAMASRGGMKMPLAALLAFAAPADAHNWLHSYSRAQHEASTTAPFRARKLSDTHAQIGPGQEITIKFDTGHNDFHYFAIFNGKDADMANKDGYKGWINDYVDSAPASADLSKSKPRLHHCRSGACGGGYFAGKAKTTDKTWCDHATLPSGDLYYYKSSLISKDKKVFYDNPKYPWLIGAIRYPQVAHLPFDHDVTCLTIPFKDPSKGQHHMVHWFWKGYYDAVDVNVFPTKIPENLIYGEVTGEYELNRIDHCQFTKPEYLVGSMADATNTVESCIDDIAEAQRNIQDAPELGINVIPVVNSPSVLDFAKEIINAPVTLGNERDHYTKFPHDYIDSAQGVAELNAKLSTSKLDYAAWRAMTKQQVNKWCQVGTTYTNPWLAVSMCANDDKCDGVAWDKKGESNLDNMWREGEVIKTCEKGTRIANKNGWTFFQKKAQPAPAGYTNPKGWTWNNHMSIGIDFQPKNKNFRFKRKDYTIKTTPNFLVDEGDKFGSRNGQKYGWKCQANMALSIRMPHDQYGTGLWSGIAPGSAFSKRCPDGSLNAWEIEVPNGVYVVTYFQGNAFENKGVGCSFENSMLEGRQVIHQNHGKSGPVEVTDGRLTLSNAGIIVHAKEDPKKPFALSICGNVPFVKIDRLQDNAPKAWYPSAAPGKKAWVQMELSKNSQDVGAVTVRLPQVPMFEPSNYLTTRNRNFRYYSCAQRWFFKGPTTCPRFDYFNFRTAGSGGNIGRMEWAPNKFEPDQYKKGLTNGKYPGDARLVNAKSTRPMQSSGIFTGAEEGAIISVSNTSCTDNGCGGTEQVCKWVRTFPLLHTFQFQDIPSNLVAECDGKIGKYVRIRFPGEGRTIAFDSVKVSRHNLEPAVTKPPAGKGMPLVCYGLQAGEATATNPAFLTSTDPNDPIFYSSCYTRSAKKIWKYIPMPSPPPPAWFFNGKCVDCESFRSNKDSSNIKKPSQWWLSTTCQDCDNAKPAWGQGQIGDNESVEPGTPVTSPTTKPPTTTPPVNVPSGEVLKEGKSCWYRCGNEVSCGTGYCGAGRCCEEGSDLAECGGLGCPNGRCCTDVSSLGTAPGPAPTEPPVQDASMPRWQVLITVSSGDPPSSAESEMKQKIDAYVGISGGSSSVAFQDPSQVDSTYDILYTYTGTRALEATMRIEDSSTAALQTALGVPVSNVGSAYSTNGYTKPPQPLAPLPDPNAPPGATDPPTDINPPTEPPVFSDLTPEYSNIGQKCWGGCEYGTSVGADGACGTGFCGSQGKCCKAGRTECGEGVGCEGFRCCTMVPREPVASPVPAPVNAPVPMPTLPPVPSPTEPPTEPPSSPPTEGAQLPNPDIENLPYAADLMVSGSLDSNFMEDFKAAVKNYVGDTSSFKNIAYTPTGPSSIIATLKFYGEPARSDVLKLVSKTPAELSASLGYQISDVSEEYVFVHGV